ncbi:protein transport protein SEC24 B-like isoform X2 [Primulina huaijiensis]|uniref:protein transport protein SEC24 B-like isoform X2 n=1 Tax=Primulina huaijiensis TaxID=1492673 RepID=UPI003CC6DE9E
MATPGGPSQGNFNPNVDPNVLANDMQNLQINNQNQQRSSNIGGGIFRPPHNTPFHQQTPPFTGSQPAIPPSGVLPRVPSPSNGPRQNTLPSNMVSARRSGRPPVAHPPPFASRPSPPGALPSSIGEPAVSSSSGIGPWQGPFPFSPLTSGPAPLPRASISGSLGNVPCTFTPGQITGGPRFPPATSSSMPRPEVVLPQSPTILPSGPSPQPPQMRPSYGIPPAGATSAMGRPPPPFSAPPNVRTSPGSSPFSAPVQGMLQASGSPYGMQTWPPQTQQVVRPPPIPGVMQQQLMFGVAPGRPPLPNQTMALSQKPQSRIDPNQIPHLTPTTVILHETRQNNQANPPPPATSDYVVKDAGNCSPRYIRCTVNQIPCTADLLSTSGMQLALLVQPLALQHPSEEPIQIVDFGETGPIRCSRCKGYINPFMKFVDQGRHFICNFCGFTDETPRYYLCNLGPDGRRRDADERPELCRGTVEFVAAREYMVRDPMPSVFFFLIDVSVNAIQTGATAAACSAITQVLIDLPDGPRTLVGIATFDSTIHFYNLKRALQQPLMLIVPDIQDVYTPLESDVVVQLAECRQHLEILLDTIPTMFQNTRTADSAFGAAVKAAFLAVKTTGGKLLVFQSVLPSIGIGSLSSREAEGRTNVAAGEKEAHKLLQPMDKIMKTMAIEFAEHQVCVDLFITSQTYVDIASLSVVSRTTGGQVYYYYPFSAISDPAKLYNDLLWNVKRPQGFEAVMRVRCSQGIQVKEYYGNYCKRLPTDIDLPAIDCDKTIMVSLRHDDKLQEGSECVFQCALLYSTVYGQRRIRVSTLSLPCTNMLSNLFRSADLDTCFTCMLKQAANEIPSAPLAQVRDHATNVCINILYSYRKLCATVFSSGQLVLPEAFKLLPLFVLALLKSSGLLPDGRIDDRSFWISYVSPLAAPLVVPLVYPRMIVLHDLDEKESDNVVIPTSVPLSSEHICDEGVYLLENGEVCLIYVGNSVQPNVLQKLFGISSIEDISNQFVLQQLENPLSKKVNAILNEIRRQRCSYLRLKLCRKGDPSGMMFFSYMVEDKNLGSLSYVEYLVHIHRQVQSKLTNI